MQRFLLIAMFTLFTAVETRADKPVDDCLDKLQGTWSAVAGERRGLPLADERLMQSKLELVIVKDKFTLRTAKNPKGVEGTFKIDTSKKPMQIDMSSIENGKPLPGIFLLEGDTLKICSGTARPTEFKTKRSLAEERLHIYKRVKP